MRTASDPALSGTSDATTDEAILAAVLTRLGLLDPGRPMRAQRIDGGVSSEVWRIDVLGSPSRVAKRPRAQLRVPAPWFAPVERGAVEARWLQLAASVDARAVPRMLGHDPNTAITVMQWLDPRRHPPWTQRLQEGRIEPAVAHAVGQRIARIHAATAESPALRRPFDHPALLEATRIEPYFRTTAAAHPGLARRFEALIDGLARDAAVVIHGDVAPKNVLVGPDGPVLIDAECASVCDPAFDLAFGGAHLLLGILGTPPPLRRAVAETFEALVAGYLGGVRWEPPAELERRAAALLPALMLARIDGKCPVEYGSPSQQRLVRHWTAPVLLDPPPRLRTVQQRWLAAV